MDPSESGAAPDRRPSQIAAYFGRLAATYGDGEYYGKRRRAVLEAIAGEIARARDVLDIGCGNGAYLAEFVSAPGGRSVTGADLSFDMLISARKRVDAQCRLLRADASRLPLRPASFDFIFASHLLQFIADTDIQGVVAGIVRCLRAGGVLIATGQRDDSTRQLLSAMVGPDRWQEYREVIFRRAPRREADARPRDRFQRAFAASGLRVEERSAPFTVTWADVDEWIRIRWMPLIPDDDRARADAMLKELATVATARSFTLHEPLIRGTRA